MPLTALRVDFNNKDLNSERNVKQMQRTEPSIHKGVLGESFNMRGPQGRRTDRSMMDCPPAIITCKYMLHL